jgi:arylsulfatase A-like enzyme
LSPIRLVLPVLLLATIAPAQTSPCRPRVDHVVVVTLDDVGVDKVPAYGHPQAGPTPTLDALAADGLLFERAYANPTCSPTRCALLTGRYGSRTGVNSGMPHYEPQQSPNGPFAPSDDLPWLPRLLADGGLRSYAVGKWHLTHVDVPDFHRHPIRTGFAWHHGHMANIIEGQTPYSWAKNIADPATWSEPTTTTYVTTDNVVEAWNALHVSAGSRSFVWLAFNAPHPPWDVAPPAGTFTPVDGPQKNAVKQQYALEAVDTLLGQLMSFHAQQHPADAARTLWIVLGDNGTPLAAIQEPTPDHQHKAEVYEGGVHVPMIAWGAGICSPGRTTDHLVHVVDLWATLLELFGVTPPAGPTDSISFADVLANPAALPARETVYVRHAEPNGFGPLTWREHAATDGHWKLVQRFGTLGPLVELFHLDVDPDELTNLWPASTPEETAAVALLQPVLDEGDLP